MARSCLDPEHREGVSAVLGVGRAAAADVGRALEVLAHGALERPGAVPVQHEARGVVLDAGAFVLRKAVVRKYGAATLSKIANGVAYFATGGEVQSSGTKVIKRNKDVIEAQKMIELGLSGMREYVQWMRMHYGASLSVNFEHDTLQGYNQSAEPDRRALESLQQRRQLTTSEKQKVDAIKTTWRQAMAQPLVYGKDLERDLLDYMEQHQSQFLASGGIARSDTVPAMLTPGEFVVNKGAVARLGSGFFELLNNLSMPAQALASHVQGFATGGLVASLASPMSVPRPAFAGETAPVRTVRVELAAGNRSVSATVDARDESRLLDILKQTKARAF